MVDFQVEVDKLKARLDTVETKVSGLNSKADSEADTILGKIKDSKVSWVIILAYTVVVFVAGAVVF